MLISTILALIGNKHAIVTGRSFAIYQSACGFIIVRLPRLCIFNLCNKTFAYLQSYCVIVGIRAVCTLFKSIARTCLCKTTLIAGPNLDVYPSAFFVVIFITRPRVKAGIINVKVFLLTTSTRVRSEYAVASSALSKINSFCYGGVMIMISPTMLALAFLASLGNKYAIRTGFTLELVNVLALMLVIVRTFLEINDCSFSTGNRYGHIPICCTCRERLMPNINNELKTTIRAFQLLDMVSHTVFVYNVFILEFSITVYVEIIMNVDNCSAIVTLRNGNQSATSTVLVKRDVCVLDIAVPCVSFGITQVDYRLAVEFENVVVFVKFGTTVFCARSIGFYFQTAMAYTVENLNNAAVFVYVLVHIKIIPVTSNVGACIKHLYFAAFARVIIKYPITARTKCTEVK